MNSLSKAPEIEKEISINSPLNLVWYAWTHSERVSEWFAHETFIEPEVGGAYELYFIPGNKTEMNTKGCRITKLIEQSELQFTWKGPDQFNNIMNQDNSLTLVKVNFFEIDNNKTRVLVTHSGFDSDESWSEALNWHDGAWTGVLNSLKYALEKGEGNLCCQPIN